jgi:hypothetical protein
MRYTRFAAFAGIGIGLLTQGAIAARPSPNVGDQTPQNYEQVEGAVDQIEPFLEGSMCGGWKADTVNGKVSTVTGVPGRNHVWDGNIPSGMAVRLDENGDGNKDNDFQYPENTVGLSTVCSQGTNQRSLNPWRFINGRPFEVGRPENAEAYPYPYFTDPPCRWRVKNEDGSFSDSAPSIPLRPISEYDPPPQYGQLDQSTEPRDRQSPPVCESFCRYLNTYVYIDCVNVQYLPDPDTGEPYPACAPQDMKPLFICNDQPADGAVESCAPGNPPTPGVTPNSRTCIGDGCRCPGPGCGQAEGYQSYYRKYEQGTYSRAPLEGIDGLQDRSSNGGPVACYGFYEEFDPYKKQTSAKDRRCVINIDVSTYRDSQKGKGEYGQNNDYDRNPNEAANQREGGNYDKDKDLWYLKFSGAFSLLNETVFDKDFGKDLTNVFLNVDRLDTSDMHATVQVNPQKPVAVSNTIRTFDDTGSGRIVVSWWQKQESEMAEILHPSTLRLLLPAGWSFGADPEDPFFKRVTKVVQDKQDLRSDRIELQIDAEEDALGEAIGYIERSVLLHVEEEPVPVLLPMGSSTEFRVRAEQWCMWYMQNFQKKNCDDAPQEVKDLIEKLEEYADNIDNARLLRGELARYAGKVLQLQREIVKPISTWVSENVDRYKTVLQEQADIRSRYTAEWTEIQLIFNSFNDEANLPWCMNQRFTSPVYSLLDEWLPSRQMGGRISADELPNISVKAKEDIIVDLSTITYMTGSIALPVLKPVQIRITDIPLPPASKEHGITEELPDLPSVEDIRQHLRTATQNLPKPPTNVKAPPPLDIAPLGEDALNSLGQTVGGIRDTLTGMRDRYDRFWKSIGPLRPGEDGGRNGIKQMKENLECYGWDSDTCQHVEMDLIERFVRIGSRPLVMLNEDYESGGAPKSFGGTCIASDDVCSPVHPENGKPRTQWEIIGPRTLPEFIDDLRRNVRNETLPLPVGGISSSAMPHYDIDLNDLLPFHDVPKPIDLSPPRSSSSSSQ